MKYYIEVEKSQNQTGLIVENDCRVYTNSRWVIQCKESDLIPIDTSDWATQVNEYENRIKELEVENKVLLDQNQFFGEESESFADTITDLQKENQIYLNDIADLKEEKNNLLLQLAAYEQENLRLKKENEKLKKVSGGRIDIISKLRKENEKMKKSSFELDEILRLDEQERNHAFIVDINAKAEKINDLQRENERLKSLVNLKVQEEVESQGITFTGSNIEKIEPDLKTALEVVAHLVDKNPKWSGIIVRGTDNGQIIELQEWNDKDEIPKKIFESIPDFIESLSDQNESNRIEKMYTRAKYDDDYSLKEFEKDLELINKLKS